MKITAPAEIVLEPKIYNLTLTVIAKGSPIHVIDVTIVVNCTGAGSVIEETQNYPL